MSTTLHLFRHDVRRLRWWLLAWAVFLIGTHWRWHVTGWDSSGGYSHWLRDYVSSETLAFWSNLGFVGVLVALLFLPHGADGVRLFWRTRPIAGRNVVQAKFLFAGLFLIALPMLVETVFWLAWRPLQHVVKLWPEILLSRTAWAALLVLVVGLAGREGKRYLFCGLGLLLAFGGWLQVGEQLQMRVMAAAGEEPWPTMESPHLLGQVWEFWTRNQPGKTVTQSADVAVVLVYVLAVAGWLVVACRYLFAGWRATRLALETAALVAVVIACAWNEFGREAWPRERAVVTHYDVGITKALDTVPVRLKEARLVSQREFLGREPRVDDPPGTKRGAVFTWETSGWPSGIVVLTRMSSIRSGIRLESYGGYDSHRSLDAREMPYFVEQEGQQLAAALPELSGYAVRRKRVAAYHWAELQAAWRDEFSREPKAAQASVELAALAPSVLATLPMGQAAKRTLDQAHIRLTGGREPRLSFELPSIQTHTYLWDPRQAAGVPNLFLLRNAKTKEAIVVGRFLCGDGWGSVSAPGSLRRLDMFRAEWQLTQVAERYGLPAAWLADAELFCVRMQLVGHVHRKVELENFQLLPAER